MLWGGGGNCVREFNKSKLSTYSLYRRYFDFEWHDEKNVENWVDKGKKRHKLAELSHWKNAFLTPTQFWQIQCATNIKSF